MVRVWVASSSSSGKRQVKLCDPLVTHGLYLSAFDVRVLHDKSLYKFALLYCGFSDGRTKFGRRVFSVAGPTVWNRKRLELAARLSP